MTHRAQTFGKIFLVVFTAILCASCASTIESRIEKNPHIYNSLSAKDKSNVRQGEISKGMSKNAVKLALGNPDKVKSGYQKGKNYDTWYYYRSRAHYGGAWNFGFGYHHQPWGYYGHHQRHYMHPYDFAYMPSVYYTSETKSIINFLNDKVVSWELVR